tara:strand:+ start:79 stop:297 length:219 start_codon:yes stop_codon:yes gene_type:complete
MKNVTKINTREPFTIKQLEDLRLRIEEKQLEQAARRYIALKVAERREFRRDMVLGFCLTMGAIVCLSIGWNI